MSSKKNFFVFLFLFLITVVTRFVNLNWTEGLGFHPDENNMVNSILSLKKDNLNPNFFAYGQFPLYLTYFTTPKHDFLTIGLTLRFWSAVFSSLSVLFFYLIGKDIFNSIRLSFIFSLLIILTPGLIQLSHFGTTESILIFVFAVNIYLSFLLYKHPKHLILLFFTGLTSGIGIATKTSAAIFIIPICFSFLFIFLKLPKQILNLLIKFFFFIFTTCFFSILLSPYSLIDYPQFLSSMKYEIGIANGLIPVFYTRQFINSIPYIFQFQKIFPYANGISIFILSFIGFCFVIRSFFKKSKANPYLLITVFSALVYFIYHGQLFTKWTRFMSPIFFCGPLFSIFFFEKIKNKIFQFIFLALSVLPGIFFLNTYIPPDIRVKATIWINQRIPINSQILSETGNSVDIPVNNLSDFNIINFDFYSLDKDVTLPDKLNKLVKTSDYIFIPSRRVFKNQNTDKFPYSQQYYQSLFSGNLDYSLIKTFAKSNSFLLNAENAEETWSVFDNPVIRIFKKNGH